jgi:hypothetical protein
MTEYVTQIASHSQLCTVSALQISQYTASEMYIQYSRSSCVAWRRNVLLLGTLLCHATKSVLEKPQSIDKTLFGTRNFGSILG